MFQSSHINIAIYTIVTKSNNSSHVRRLIEEAVRWRLKFAAILLLMIYLIISDTLWVFACLMALS